MICPRCGTANADTNGVCMNCGEVLSYQQPVNNYYQEPVQPVQPVQPVYQNPYQPQIPENYSETVSIGDWIGSLLLMYIPVVNIIMIFVWAFGSNKKSKSNYFKACLIIGLAVFVLTILAVVILAAAGISMGSYLM